MIKLEGRVLLFDVINQLSNKIPKDCKLTMPEKVPLTWNFEHDKPIGFATPIRDDKGIYATAETFSNEYIGIEDIRDILTDGKIGVGGYYIINKRHNEGELDIIDEATLLEIGLTLAPVREEYYFKIVEEKKMSERNYERCNGCPYYYEKIDQCMVGDEDVPDNLKKKCDKEDKKND